MGVWSVSVVRGEVEVLIEYTMEPSNSWRRREREGEKGWRGEGGGMPHTLYS